MPQDLIHLVNVIISSDRGLVMTESPQNWCQGRATWEIRAEHGWMNLTAGDGPTISIYRRLLAVTDVMLHSSIQRCRNCWSGVGWMAFTWFRFRYAEQGKRHSSNPFRLQSDLLAKQPSQKLCNGRYAPRYFVQSSGWHWRLTNFIVMNLWCRTTTPLYIKLVTWIFFLGVLNSDLTFFISSSFTSSFSMAT